MMVVPEDSCATPKIETGAGAKLQLLGATVNTTDVVLVRLPEVPVTVMLYVPGAVVGATFKLKVEVPVVVIERGLNLARTPVGRLDADKVTAVL